MVYGNQRRPAHRAAVPVDQAVLARQLVEAPKVVAVDAVLHEGPQFVFDHEHLVPGLRFAQRHAAGTRTASIDVGPPPDVLRGETDRIILVPHDALGATRLVHRDEMFPLAMARTGPPRRAVHAATRRAGTGQCLRQQV